MYGCSHAFLVTGEDRCLTYARAGLDRTNAHATDPVHGGYCSRLELDGDPVDPRADKDVLSLASLGWPTAGIST